MFPFTCGEREGEEEVLATSLSSSLGGDSEFCNTSWDSLIASSACLHGGIECLSKNSTDELITGALYLINSSSIENG